MKSRRQLTITLIIISCAILLVNIIGHSIHHRFDATEDKDYTLSDATKNMLKNLQDPITITAYFTENLPPQYAEVRKEFKDIISEYASLSNGKIAFRFIDPNESPELEQEAINSGIGPVLISVREKDRNEQQKAFLGAKIEVGTQKEVIPIIQKQTPMEYTLSTSIKKLTIVNKPYIGIVSGHGELPLQNLGQAMSEIGFLYNIEEVILSDTLNLSKYKTLVINAPKSQYSETDLGILDNYIAQGGKLFINLEHINADLQQSMQLTLITTGLEGWLTEKGIVVEDNVVIDKKCGNIGVVQQQGMFSMTVPISFPYIPIVSNFSDHPITSSLKGLSFAFASSIQYTGDDKYQFTPLIFTSESSATQTLPAYINIQKKWTDHDFTTANIALGGVLTGSFNNGPETSIVVVGDGDYAASQGNQKVNADNINLFANTIDWLSDDTGLIELRSKGINYRPIKELSDTKKATIKWVNFLLPIILIIVYGIVNWQIRLIRRNKRTEENYVQ